MFKVWTIEDIKEVLNEAVSITGVGIDDIEIKISTKKMTRTFGWCGFKRIDGKIKTTNIKLSYWLVNGYYSEEDVRDTILHEYAHHYCNTVYEKDCNHNDLWKDACKLVGAKPTQYAIGYICDNESFKRDCKTASSYKYEIKCTCCENHWYRDRLRNIEEYERRYRCGRCGSKLKVKILR